MTYGLVNQYPLIVAAMQLFSCCHIYRTESVNVKTFVANINDTVTILCNISKHNGSRWNFDNKTIFSNFGGVHTDNRLVLNNDNYTVIIDPVGIDHEGKYTCINGESIYDKTSLWVQSKLYSIIMKIYQLLTQLNNCFERLLIDCST